MRLSLLRLGCVALIWHLAALGALAAAPVWIISNGFHSSIVAPAREFPGVQALRLDPRADWLVIGWGAEAFYQGRTNAWTLARALVPGPSVLHVVPVRGSLTRRFPHSALVRLPLATPPRRMLLEKLAGAFVHDARGQPIAIGRGYSPESRFYRARERFYFPNMCNLWLAAKLRRSGVPMGLLHSITAGGLVYEARRFGPLVQPGTRPADVF